MATVIGLPIVSSCSVSSCGFNHDGCHAHAISVVASDHAHCGTFVNTAEKGGHAESALVGACTRADCTHNANLSCTAEAIQVGAAFDAAACLTFETRAAAV